MLLLLEICFCLSEGCCYLFRFVWAYCVTSLRTLIHCSKGLRMPYSVVRCLTIPFLVGHLLTTLVNILRLILNSLSCFTSYYKYLTLSYITLSNPILQTCESNSAKPCLHDVIHFLGFLKVFEWVVAVYRLFKESPT